MQLPETEHELRLHAIEVLKKFEADIKEKVGILMPPDDEICFDFRSIKAGVIWAARSAIRAYCPQLEASAEQDMEGMFGDEDRPL